MEIIALVLSTLMNLQMPLFLLALAGGMSAPYFAQKGHLKKARWAAGIGFGGSSLLAVLYVGAIIFALRSGAGSRIGWDALMACLWTYFAIRDYRMLKMFRGR